MPGVGRAGCKVTGHDCLQGMGEGDDLEREQGGTGHACADNNRMWNDVQCDSGRCVPESVRETTSLLHSLTLAAPSLC